MAETGRAEAAGGSEEGCRGREEEAETPGGGGKVQGPPSLSAAHMGLGAQRHLSVLPGLGVWETSTTRPSPSSKTWYSESTGIGMKRLIHSTRVLICSLTLDKPIGLSGYLLDLLISKVKVCI